MRVNERGMTLLEILTALAILSLLATIALPRFQVYNMRAFQTEAKTNLSALGRALSVYIADKGVYTDNLNLLDWTPDGAPKYIYGFVSDNKPTASGTNDTAELKSVKGGSFTTVKMIDVSGNPLTEDDLPATAIAADEAFTVGATANLDDDATLDQWTLNDQNALTYVSNDLIN